MAERPKKFMADAVKPSRRGLFTRKARAAGKSVAEYAREKAHAPGRLGKEARFAELGSRISKRNARKRKT